MYAKVPRKQGSNKIPLGVNIDVPVYLRESTCDRVQSYLAYHTHRGRHRLGLTFDPGAAGGLGGTDTLREYHKGQPPLANNHTVEASDQTYSGISGDACPSLGEIRQEVQCGRLKLAWHGDMIGGHGSWCPMLLGLPPLVEFRAIAFHGLFSNGDGGLILFADEDSGCSKAHCLRLLYTDSGHYLLPTDDPEGQKREEPQMAKVCADALRAVVASLDKLSSKTGKFLMAKIAQIM